MKALLLDGYVDEPSYLGVPPYVSPYPRAAAGAAISAGATVEYMTIGEVRAGKELPKADLLVAIGGFSVPGKYLKGYPASVREMIEIGTRLDCPGILGGPMASYFSENTLRENFDLLVTKDIEAAVWDFVSSGRLVDRRRSLEEFDEWSIQGAQIIKQHPDFGGPLIAEIQTYRGCIRYFVGGCSFCVEPEYGKVEFRNPDSIIAETEALSNAGAKHLRLGGQSCFISYMAEGVGKSETPRPSPGVIHHLLRGIREAANPKVLHLDNANPAVIAEHPEESTRIMESIVKLCTSGNVLALGLESADPVVRESNNLNATSEQALKAIEIMNRAGGQRGPSGLPMLLPGINFIIGLKGESRETFEKNRDFLLEIVRRNLMLRRINIRQAIPSREGFEKQKIHRSSFVKFKNWVREKIDHPMLEKIVPMGTVLRDVYLETHDGNKTFGRQVGSYPILVGLPYKCEIERFVDVIILSHGYRSVTGVEFPFDINGASLAALSSLPKIGEKRARRIALARPITSSMKLCEALDSEEAFQEIMKYVSFPNEERIG